MISAAYFRSTGDMLTLVFSPSGTLSTARLAIGDNVTNVSDELPGIRENRADNYLRVFGFSKDYVDNPVVNVINDGLASIDMFLCFCEHQDDGYYIGVSSLSERTRVCPVIKAIVLFDDSGKIIEVISYNDSDCISSLLSLS